MILSQGSFTSPCSRFVYRKTSSEESMFLACMIFKYAVAY